MSDRVRTDIALDFEQRQRASALEESVTDDELAAAYEIIYLRDKVREMGAALSAAEVEFSGIAPEAQALQLVRRAMKDKGAT